VRDRYTSNTKPQRPHRYPGIYHLYKDGAQPFMKIFPGVCDPSNSRHIIIEMGSDFSIGRPFDEAGAWLFRHAVLLYSLTNPGIGGGVVLMESIGGHTLTVFRLTLID
jgi:hypothetical protein